MPTIYELNNMYGKTVNITTEDGFVYLGSVMAGVSGSSDKVWLDEKTGIWFLYRHQIKNVFVVE